MSDKNETNPDAEPQDAEVLGDGRVPSSSMRSYALLTPEVTQLYMGFYKATYI